MKVSERLGAVQQIATELEKRYSFTEIGEFTSAFGLQSSPPHWDDNYDYARQIVAKASVSILAEIVDDLGIEAFTGFTTIRQVPAIWEEGESLRVFISHLSSEKVKATRFRDAMRAKGMSGFVAHEDIEPTLEWQVQIERALSNMELFVSMHTAGFSKSVWTQQEIGYAVSTGVKIIALRMEEDPTGFIGKHQALARGTKNAAQIVTDIQVLLRKDERLKERYEKALAAQIDDDVPF